MTDSFGWICEFKCGDATARPPIGNRYAVLLSVAPLTGAKQALSGPLIASAIRKSPKGADHDDNR